MYFTTIKEIRTPHDNNMILCDTREDPDFNLRNLGFQFQVLISQMYLRKITHPI